MEFGRYEFVTIYASIPRYLHVGTQLPSTVSRFRGISIDDFLGNVHPADTFLYRDHFTWTKRLLEYINEQLKGIPSNILLF